MEAPAINEIRQRKKKSDESENAFEGEKEIPPSEEEIEICHDAELEKEIPPSGREKETLPHAERENEIPPNGNGKETSPDAKREKDTPPGDDICPICFGNYNIPCKTNCGHWFCGVYTCLHQNSYYIFFIWISILQIFLNTCNKFVESRLYKFPVSV